MPTQFSSQDLGRIFDGRALTRGRSLGLAGGVTVQLDDDTITGVVQDRAAQYRVRITPARMGRRVVFDHHCSCGTRACAHLAAAAFAALDRFPELRRPEQQTFLDSLVTTPEPAPETQRIVFELAPAESPHACVVSTRRVGERSGTVTPLTPAEIAADSQAAPAVREAARALGAGHHDRTGVAAVQVADVLHALVRSGHAQWHAGGRRLIQGETRIVATAAAVRAAAPVRRDRRHQRALVCRCRHRGGRADPHPAAWPGARSHTPPPAEPRRRAAPAADAEPMIIERSFTPVLELTRFPCPDGFGRMQTMDALLLAFDYGGAAVAFDDDRQFVRDDGPGGPVFVRRDKAGEAAVVDAIHRDGLVQMRMATSQSAKGRMVFVFRGRDAAEAWQAFVAERLPVLQGLGWQNRIDQEFGPRLVESVGDCDLRVADASGGRFSLDLGIEIDGARQPLLPILQRLRDRGGMGVGAHHRRPGDHQPGRRPHPEAAGRTDRPAAGGDGRPDRGGHPRPPARPWNWRPARRRASWTWRSWSSRAGRTARRLPTMCRASAASPTFRRCRCRPASPPRCGPTSSRA